MCFISLIKIQWKKRNHKFENQSVLHFQFTFIFCTVDPLLNNSPFSFFPKSFSFPTPKKEKKEKPTSAPSLHTAKFTWSNLRSSVVS